MFTNPIKHIRLNTMEELLKFSYRTQHKAKPFTRCRNDEHIAFADKFGTVWVTPYRSEISLILDINGYRVENIENPLSYDEEAEGAYGWLRGIADEENWAETYEEAFKIASQKGIKPVEFKQKLQIKEIIYAYQDFKNCICYNHMVDQFLEGKSKENIATYIICDEKTLLICDEYGRTFFVKTKTVINDLVNALIEAGYTRTSHPEMYIWKIH